jgi:hypothetical protein
VRIKHRTTEFVIGIDQSYSGFGITFLRDDYSHTTRVAAFDPTVHGPGVTRLRSISSWLSQTIVQECSGGSAVHICMEDYAPMHTGTALKAGELGAAVKLALISALPTPVSFPTIVGNTQVKKFVMDGTAQKSDMKLGVYKRWGVEFKDDNACDSYALARIAAALQWPKGQQLTKAQDEVLAKLTPHTERCAS